MCVPAQRLLCIAAWLLFFSTGFAAKPIQRFHAPIDREEAHGIALRPDGKLLVLAGKKTTIGFEPKTGRQVFRHDTPDVEQSFGPSIAFSPDGTLVAFSGERMAQLYTVDPWKLSKTLNAKSDDSFVGAFAFSPDGKRLAAGTSEWRGKRFVPVVRVWDIATGKIVRSFDHEVVLNWGLEFSPNGKTLYSTDFSRVEFFDLDKAIGPTKIRLKVRDERLGEDVDLEALSKIALHPDGMQFVLADQGGLFLLGDITGRKVLAKRWQHTAFDDDANEFPPDEGESEWATEDIAFTRDGKALLSLQERDEGDTMHAYLHVRDPKTLKIRSMHRIPAGEDADEIHVAAGADLVVTSGWVTEPDRMVFQVWDVTGLLRTK